MRGARRAHPLLWTRRARAQTSITAFCPFQEFEKQCILKFLNALWSCITAVMCTWKRLRVCLHALAQANVYFITLKIRFVINFFCVSPIRYPNKGFAYDLSWLPFFARKLFVRNPSSITWTLPVQYFNDKFCFFCAQRFYLFLLWFIWCELANDFLFFTSRWETVMLENTKIIVLRVILRAYSVFLPHSTS